MTLYSISRILAIGKGKEIEFQSEHLGENRSANLLYKLFEFLFHFIVKCWIYI